jgi:hypothetical protein
MTAQCVLRSKEKNYFSLAAYISVLFQTLISDKSQARTSKVATDTSIAKWMASLHSMVTVPLILIKISDHADLLWCKNGKSTVMWQYFIIVIVIGASL